MLHQGEFENLLKKTAKTEVFENSEAEIQMLAPSHPSTLVRSGNDAFSKPHQTFRVHTIVSATVTYECANI